jgi:hypothetical protein
MKDNPGFMGRTDNGRYETVIDLLVKIRKRENTSGFLL